MGIKLIGICLVLALAVIAISLFNTTSHSEKPPAGEVASFGAGCFWGSLAAFEHVIGVISTRVGYTGGHVAAPTYEQVCSGKTGHTETVEVTFNPKIVSYRQLIGIFWQHHDPTRAEKTQYKSVIFYHNSAQRDAAIAEKARLTKIGKFHWPILTVDSSRIDLLCCGRISSALQ